MRLARCGAAELIAYPCLEDGSIASSISYIIMPQRLFDGKFKSYVDHPRNQPTPSGIDLSYSSVSDLTFSCHPISTQTTD